MEDTSQAVNPYNEGDLYTIFKNDGYQVSEVAPVDSNLCISLAEQYIDTYYADQKMKEKEILLVDQDGKCIDLAQSREDLSNALQGDSYLIMNASTYKKWKAAILESGAFDAESTKQLEEDNSECFSSAEDLQTLCDMNGISYEGIVASMQKRNLSLSGELMENRAIHITNDKIPSVNAIEGYDRKANIVYPIIYGGDVSGAVCMMEDENHTLPSESDIKLVQVAAAFLGKQMELL